MLVVCAILGRNFCIFGNLLHRSWIVAGCASASIVVVCVCDTVPAIKAAVTACRLCSSTVSVSGNALTAVTGVTSTFSLLRSLDVSNNSIMTLPSRLFSIATLEHLSVARNQVGVLFVCVSTLAGPRRCRH